MIETDGMIRRAYLSLALTAIACLPACADQTNSEIVAVCEQKLKEQLLSPSGYVRIAVTELLQEETIQHSETNAHEIMLEYDAPNAFGVSIRNKALCEYKRWCEAELRQCRAHHCNDRN